MSFSDLETMSLNDFIDRNRGDDGTLWFFQHIPKTAGSSFSAELAKHSGPYFNIFIDYEDRDTPYGDAFAAATARFLSSAETRRFRSASGHLSIDLVERIREAHPETRVVTFLREPQARVISDYRYQRTPAHPPYRDFIERYPTVESYVEAPRNQNSMARHLLGDSASEMSDDEIRDRVGQRHDFIGLLEMYPMSFNIIFRLIGVEGLWPQEHKRKTVASDVNKVEVTPALSELIRHHNHKDFVLYEHVRDVLLSHRDDFRMTQKAAI